jgi:hypothetical protein
MCGSVRLDSHAPGQNNQPHHQRDRNVGLLKEDAMSITFDVYRIAQDGQRELIQTTQSAREARKARDADPGEVLVVVRDDRVDEVEQRNHPIEVDTRGEVEGDYPV